MNDKEYFMELELEEPHDEEWDQESYLQARREFWAEEGIDIDAKDALWDRLQAERVQVLKEVLQALEEMPYVVFRDYSQEPQHILSHDCWKVKDVRIVFNLALKKIYDRAFNIKETSE